MALGKRKRERQLEAFVSASDLPQSPGRPFYTALNRLLAENAFDSFVEALCAPFNENTPVAPYKEADGLTYTRNPQSKWDWFVVGGRWRDVVPGDRAQAEDILSHFKDGAPSVLVDAAGWHSGKD